MKLEDSVDSMIFDLLEVPIVDKDVEGAVDNTTVDGNVFTDYLWLKKNYVQKWSIMCDDEYSQLRGFYTRQFDNASVPTYKLYTGQNLSEDFIASGKYIMVNNTTDYNAPINSFELLGDAEQTTYSGKNLCSSTSVPVATQVYFNFDKNTITAGTYTLSTALNEATSNNTVSLVIDGTATNLGTFAGSAGATVKTTFTLSAAQITSIQGSTTSLIRLYKSGANFTNPTWAQLEAGSTATAYEPYVGGTASPNPDYPQAVNTVTGEQTVELVGKNLFDKTQAGDGWLDSVGNIVAGTTWKHSDYIPITGGATYTTSGMTSGAGANPSRCYYDASKNFISGTKHNTNNPFTDTAPANAVYMVESMQTADIDSVQLELGSTATTYEPYQGQTRPVNLGKNLFSISQDTIISNAYLENNTTLTFDDLNSVSITATGTQGAQYLYRIITGLDSTQNYTFSFKGTKNVKGSTGLSYIRITTYGSNDGNTWTNLGVSGENNPTQGTTYSFTKTLTGYTQYRFMVFNNADTPVQVGEKTTYSEMMLELGSTATAYAPYFTPIELAKIGTYQDYIFNDNGTWKIHKAVGKVVLDGTNADITWSLTAQSGAYNFWYRNNTMGALDERHEKLCDNFTYSPLAFNNGAPTPSLCENQYNSAVLTIFKTDGTQGTTVADWKTWLASNPTTVFYALATPTTTEITNQALIDQLNAIQNAYLYTGINNISNNAVSPNLAGDIDLGYTLIYEKENIIIPQTSVRLTLTDGGVINVCGCRQNVQLGMRETIQ